MILLTKELMNKLHDSVDYNKLKFEYMGPTKDVSFYEYMGSKELFNAIRLDLARQRINKMSS